MVASEQLTEAVTKATVKRDGRMTLSCADAFKLAEDLDAELSSIYVLCNEHDIKIVRCQLGCFP